MDEINILYIVDLLGNVKIVSIILVILSIFMILVFVGMWCECDYSPVYKNGIIVFGTLSVYAIAAIIIIPSKEILEKVVETNNITLINNFYHYAYNGLRLITYGVFMIYSIIKITDVVGKWLKNRRE